MSKFIRFLCYAGCGALMTISGYGFTSWQYWALLGLLAVCDLSHAFD